MKPENTPLEKENHLQNSKPLFSGSMSIFWGIYFKPFFEVDLSTSSICCYCWLPVGAAKWQSFENWGSHQMSTKCLSSPIKLSQQNIPHVFTDQSTSANHVSLSLLYGPLYEFSQWLFTVYHPDLLDKAIGHPKKNGPATGLIPNPDFLAGSFSHNIPRKLPHTPISHTAFGNPPGPNDERIPNYNLLVKVFFGCVPFRCVETTLELTYPPKMGILSRWFSELPFRWDMLIHSLEGNLHQHQGHHPNSPKSPAAPPVSSSVSVPSAWPGSLS